MFNWLKKILPVSGKAVYATVVAEPCNDTEMQPELLNEREAYKRRGNELLAKGRLEEAAECYRQAVAINPNYAEAYLNLAFVLRELNLFEEAEHCLKQAILINPKMEDAYYILGTVSQEQGNLDAAIESFSKALELKPDFEMVYGDLFYAFFQNGQNIHAESIIKKGIALNPDIAEFHYYLGTLYAKEEKFDQSISCFLKTLSLHSDYFEAYCNLGHAFQAQGRLDEAVEYYRHALTLKPDDAEAHNNLGCALLAQGKLDEAFESCRQALSLKPDFSAAHRNLLGICQAQGRLDEVVGNCQEECSLNPNNVIITEQLGHAFLAQGKLGQAVECYRHAVSLNPKSSVSHNNLGYALQAQGKLHEAIECYRHAIFLNPDIAETHNNLGSALEGLAKVEDAIQSYRRAISLRPSHIEAYNNLGHAYQAQGKLDEAIEYYRHALSMKPDYAQVHSNLLFVRSFHENCSPDQYIAEARIYGSRVTAQAKPYSSWSVKPVEIGLQPFRVGLVSGDFKNHPVVFFLESILANLDPARVELIAYPTQMQEDECTARIKPRFAAWKPIAGLCDEYAARKIHEDGIHILIDLAGHTAHNRLPLFAWKPAPVQVSWLGYLASTGVPAMDYLLADTRSVSESHQKHFTETVWRLPDSLFCLTPPAATSKKLALSPLPAMRNGYITFGSFQRMDKVTDNILVLWGRILDTLPQARLRLQNTQMNCPVTRENLLQRLARVGVKQERVMVEGANSRVDYLAAYADVDIVLDTFPYPGVTTTCEALWMGVPTVTLAGHTLLSRQGISLLTCAGLGTWIAGDEEDYVARALAHAADLNSLAQLRSGLREKVLASPLFDAPRFARHLEDALQGMWQQKISKVAEQA